MPRLRPLNTAIAVLGFIIIGTSQFASAQNEPEGKLSARSSERTVVEPTERRLKVGTATLAKILGITPPTCDPRPPGPAQSVTKLRRSLGIENFSQLGVLVSPTRKDLGLHTFWLEIYAGNKLVFRTKPECTGCSVTYSAIAPAQSNRFGYLFVLDKDALAAANKLFVSENNIVLKVSGHNGARTTFTFLKVRG